MQEAIPQSPNKMAVSRRAFTLIEILVTVGIILLLVAILIPSLYHAKLSAKIASTRSTLSSIRTGLSQYFTQFHNSSDQNEFKSYPDSHPANINTGTYGTGSNIIAPGRGPALLAQALMGYLPGTLDGAGPDSSNAAYNNDPRLGFRTRNTLAKGGLAASGGFGAGMAVGQVYGPYAPNTPDTYKVNDTNSAIDPTQSHDQSFYDSFGNEILYFRAQQAPTGTTASVIFNTSTAVTAPTVPLFFADDCSKAPPNSSAAAPVAPTVGAATGFDPFFALLAGAKNTGLPNLITSYPGPVLGAKSYLLISAGPDAKYFTDDDIVMSDHE